jgi:hypothetical protein
MGKKIMEIVLQEADDRTTNIAVGYFNAGAEPSEAIRVLRLSRAIFSLASLVRQIGEANGRDPAVINEALCRLITTPDVTVVDLGSVEFTPTPERT